MFDISKEIETKKLAMSKVRIVRFLVFLLFGFDIKIVFPHSYLWRTALWSWTSLAIFV